jgi:hypothetical protein
MMPVTFIYSTYPQARTIILADAAMLDDERLTELRQLGLSYLLEPDFPILFLLANGFQFPDANKLSTSIQ